MWGDVLRYYRELPFLGKFLFSTMFSTIAGTSLMALLATLANYWFAFRYGARIPVEGVPFLTFAIATISFLLFSTAFITVLIFYSFSRFRQYCYRKLNWVDQTHAAQRYDLLVFTLLMLYIMFARSMAEVVNRIFSSSVSYLVQSVIAAIVGYYAGIILSRNTPRVNQYIAAVGVIVALNMALGLFTQGRYDSFLRLTRFGGGLEATINRNEKEPVTAYLFLYTEKRVILYKPKANSYLEIPASDVQSIEYSQYPKWKLPEIKLGQQLRYVK